MKKVKGFLPRKSDVDKVIMVSSLLKSMLFEMREFAKKKQDGVVNKLKVDMINKLLKEIKKVLTEAKEPTVSYLKILDEETLPQNSDTVIILGQFAQALKQFSDKYYKQMDNSFHKAWHTLEGYYEVVNIEDFS